MSKVVSLAGTPSSASMEPNKPIIDALVSMLQEARDGRIQHLAAVYTDGRGPPCDLYIGTGEPEQAMMLVGGMEMCKHTMLMTQYNQGPPV